MAATNTFGQGRSVYLVTLPHNLGNCRLLERTILWAAHKERYFQHCFSSNYQTGYAAFPKAGWCVALNHTDQEQATSVSDPSQRHITLTLGPWPVAGSVDSLAGPGE